MKILIIGYGPAGYYTANQLKKNNPNLEVHIFEKSGYPFYTKLRLPDFIAGVLERDKLFIDPNTEKTSLGVILHLNTTVEEIDIKNHLITTSHGDFIYDKLIFATGSNPYIPTIKGEIPSDVYTLRTIEDAEKIKRKLNESDCALIIGGGLLGLELGSAMLRPNLELHVAETFMRLLPGRVTEVEAEEIKKQLTLKGFNFHLGITIESLEKIGELFTVYLSDGTKIETPLCVINAGIRPNIGLAEKFGILTNKGILVDHKFQTTVSDVFAIGDCAEIDEKIPGLWMAAKKQGEALADILCSKLENYVSPEWKPKLKLTGITLN